MGDCGRAGGASGGGSKSADALRPAADPRRMEEGEVRREFSEGDADAGRTTGDDELETRAFGGRRMGKGGSPPPPWALIETRWAPEGGRADPGVTGRVDGVEARAEASAPGCI
mmetsp:Transcript_50989/g.123610  ORF Transcript_50989/g.123610 Transcript_50989/m.123610 type:complete len:113 (+) Transcript_50989:900-1238(+)